MGVRCGKDGEGSMHAIDLRDVVTLGTRRKYHETCIFCYFALLWLPSKFPVTFKNTLNTTQNIIISSNHGPHATLSCRNMTEIWRNR